MIDWVKYSVKPQISTIQDYPTIVDVLEDILEDEEEKASLTKYPLTDSRTELYNIEEPGHYFVMRSESDPQRVLLYPTGRNALTFFRGESGAYDTCLPSLLRTNDEKTKLCARLQAAELECILKRHPVISDFLHREFRHVRLSRPFRMTVPFRGLAQHYGILTPFLDLSNDKWVAAFFAVTNYSHGSWGVVTPSDSQRYGSFYRLAKVDFNNKNIPQPTPIGVQFFNRPGRQSAFTLDMTNMEDFKHYPGVERIYFRHDSNANELVYDLCQQGCKFFPHDSLVDVVDQLKQSNKYSLSAVEMTRLTYYSNKSASEMQSFVTGHGFEVVHEPLICFNTQTMQKEWDEWQREGAQRLLNSMVIMPVTIL